MDASEYKHDGIVDLVELELKRRGYKYNYKFVEYEHNYCEPGEIDLLCLTPDNKYILLFEIKGKYSHHNKNKAVKQLRYGESWIHKYSSARVFKFFVYESLMGGVKYNFIKDRK